MGASRGVFTSLVSVQTRQEVLIIISGKYFTLYCAANWGFKSPSEYRHLTARLLKPRHPMITVQLENRYALVAVMQARITMLFIVIWRGFATKLFWSVHKGFLAASTFCPNSIWCAKIWSLPKNKKIARRLAHVDMVKLLSEVVHDCAHIVCFAFLLSRCVCE